MSDTVFVQRTLREIYTAERFGSVKAAQFEAYNFLRRQVSGQITLRRVRAMFEGKANIIRGEEKDAVRTARLEEAQNERLALRARLERLDDLLAAMDQEFHGPALAPDGVAEREEGERRSRDGVASPLSGARFRSSGELD